MKKFLIVFACLALVFGGFMAYSTVDNTTPVATASGHTYNGTIYVAGHGGHFAKVDITVDPSAAAPIKINDLDRIEVGSPKGHIIHDARIDSKDRNTMYWSTYKLDKATGGAHVGKIDLAKGKVTKEIDVKLPKGTGFKGALYCGSAQSKKSYIPFTMTKEAYIDVYDKRNLKRKQRIFLRDLGYIDNYIFFHGRENPDMTKLFVTINLTKKWTDKNKMEPGGRLGIIDNLLLDMKSFEKGKLKVLAKSSMTGSKTKTFTFRQSFTPDGKYILQAGADRFYLIDGNTLELVAETMMEDGENHDAVSTPDGKYAVLTLRTKVNKKVDGAIQLFDIAKRQTVGKPVSVCNGCHAGGVDVKKAVLCGADVNWK